MTNRCLRLFGHIARSSPREDHYRALAACIWQVPPDWKRPGGKPSHTWLRAIEADLCPLNFGLVTAWRKATTRDKMRHIVDTAMLQWSTLWKKEERKLSTEVNCHFFMAHSAMLYFQLLLVKECTKYDVHVVRSNVLVVCADYSNAISPSSFLLPWFFNFIFLLAHQHLW